MLSTSGLPWPPLEAATEIAFVAFAGDVIDPTPNSPKSLPAETVETTPASAAALRAFATTSRLGSISVSPSDRLMTSMPSRTAASMAAASSGEFPFAPNSLGMPSAL